MLPIRRWVTRVHVYGGLLCAPYMVIFGISSLQFNHHLPKPPSNPPISESWEHPLPEGLPSENLAQAEKLRDDLGLMGWPLPWKMRRDGEGGLHYEMERPGKSYVIRTIPQEKKVVVETRAKGFWEVVKSMHALSGLPHSRLIQFWGFYTELCTWVVLFASGSGVWMWARAGHERRAGLVTLTLATAASLSFILFVILRG